MQGHRVGYGWTKTAPFQENDQDLVRITSGAVLELERFGQQASQRVELECIETPQGGVLRFRTELASGGAPTVSRGEVQGSTLTLELGGKKQSVEWPDNCLGFLGPEQSLERQPMKPGESRTIMHLAPVFNQVATVELKAIREEDTQLLSGARRLLRIESVAKLRSGQIDSVLWVDRAGRKWKTLIPGTRQESYRTTRQEAQRGITGPRFDLGRSPIVKLARPLERPQATIQAVYRARLAGGPIADVFVDDATQDVSLVNETTAEITVRAGSRWSEAIRPGEEVGPSAEDLAPSGLLQSDDRRVRALALAAAPSPSADTRQTALALSEFVFQQMKPNTHYAQAIATAADTASTLEGDCTEHAMLLAAMCRAQRIPARVAIGLVYYPSEQGFAYHMWTEAWIGDRWLPLDATRAGGAVSAAYLKIAHSSLQGADAYAAFLPVQQVLGRLELEVRSLEHSPIQESP